MTRFAWIQFRMQAFVAAAGLAVIALVVGLTGPHLAHLYDTNVANCASRANCDTATQLFMQHDLPLQGWLNILVVLVPAVVGVFWGAPLVARELESGSFRLAWTQSVTRSRWLGVKLLLVGAASMVVAGLLSLMVTWWWSPFDKINQNQFATDTFGERGIVAIGYAAFAFAVGVTAGVLIRRTLPAMAATLVAFIAARLAFIQWIRPNLMDPVHLTSALDSRSQAIGFGSFNGGPFTLIPKGPPLPNAWVLSTKIVDGQGRALPASVVTRACPRLGAALPPVPKVGAGFRGPAPSQIQDALQNCIASLSSKYHVVVAYQPARRYWAFQWAELGIFLGAALVLGALCFWWVRRRLT
jgi:hypothetical protein